MEAPLNGGTVLLALLALAHAAPPRIEAIRAEFARVEEAAAAGALAHAAFALGGGQNPVEVEVHWQGCDEAAVEQDPYAECFHVRRVRLTRTLPAVGPTSFTAWYQPDGAPFFALVSGVDVWGAGYELRPPDQLRVYWEGDAPLRVVLSGDGEPATWDLPHRDAEVDRRARAAAAALLARARDVSRALHALGG